MIFKIDVVEHNGQKVFSAPGTKGAVLFDKFPLFDEFTFGTLKALRSGEEIGTARIRQTGGMASSATCSGETGTFQEQKSKRHMRIVETIPIDGFEVGDCIELNVKDVNPDANLGDLLQYQYQAFKSLMAVFSQHAVGEFIPMAQFREELDQEENATAEAAFPEVLTFP